MRCVLLSSLVACTASTTMPPTMDQPDASQGQPDGSNQVTPDASIDAPAPPPIVVLRGVDRASAFSLTEAHTLASAHGVKWTGVYIGGPCSAGSGWTKTLLTQIHNAEGWTFMPIYVGQQ